MKLYHNGQLEGWQIPGAQDKKAERVDVPGSPAELAAWLNDRAVTAAPAAAHAFAKLALEATGRGPLNAEEAEAAGGAVLNQADVDQVNGTRPAFLGKLSADEIERRRMEAHHCPKCGNSRSYLHALERLEVESWILERATPLDLDALADLIEEKRK